MKVQLYRLRRPPYRRRRRRRLRSFVLDQANNNCTANLHDRIINRRAAQPQGHFGVGEGVPCADSGTYRAACEHDYDDIIMR